MLERIYVDNFRTLVNCEIKFTSVSLLLGPNGSGKSSVLDVAHALKSFVGGIGLVSDLFPSAELTRWQTLGEQAFELDIRTEQGVYRYSLKIQHSADRRRCRVMSETLHLDGHSLFTFLEGEIQLYDDQHRPGPTMSFDWNRSGLSAIYSRPDNMKLTEFKRRLGSMLFLSPCPPVMVTDSQEEEEELDGLGRNFPSWYRFISRQDLSKQLDLFRELGQAIDGFEQIKLEGAADSTLTLRVLIKPNGAKKAIAYKLSELSDGQRQLMLLHAVLFGMADEHRMLFLDEPDNYLSPREVEPWITALMDAVGRTIGQAVVISHHPEVIDHLAREKGIWLTRDSSGPTRVDVGKARDTAPLKPSEMEARGW